MVSTVRLACRWSGVRFPDQACFIIYSKSLFISCKNLALNLRDCLSLFLAEETLKAVGPFYLVSIQPRGSKISHTGGKQTESPVVDSTPLSTTPVLAQRWAVWSIHLSNRRPRYQIVNSDSPASRFNICAF